MPRVGLRIIILFAQRLKEKTCRRIKFDGSVGKPETSLYLGLNERFYNKLIKQKKTTFIKCLTDKLETLSESDSISFWRSLNSLENVDS